MEKEINWKMGGPAGSGLVAAGVMFAKVFSRAGLHVFEKRSFHSNIKGLHTWTSVRVSTEEVFSQGRMMDIVVALDNESAERHIQYLSEGSAIIYDPEFVKVDEAELKKKGIILCSTPLVKFATEGGGKEIMKNTVALGVSFGLLDCDFKLLEQAIKDQFAGKKEEIAKANIKAGKRGYDFAKESFKEFKKTVKPPANQPKRIFINGNQAIAFGALQAGCKFISAYPMTPSTGIIMTLAKHERDADMVVKQTEDELAALLTAAGAAHAGARAMTATSGGGFALMNEGFGMVGSCETPLVVVVVQRPGPSSGLPTRTAQCDLKHLVNAAPGEVPRIVIAPGDFDDCFYKTAEAFNLAEKYQIPVIIVSDKYLGMNYKNIEPFDVSKVKIDRGKLLSEAEANKLKNYKRYALTEDGVSPRVLPGKGPIHITSSYVVDEAGNVDETSENTVKMLDKLYKKIPHILKDFEPLQIIGPKDADITLVSWGSTKGPILEAMKMLEKDGITTNYVQIVYITPFQTDEVNKILENSKKTVCIENNKTSPLAAIIKEHTGKDVDHKVNKYDGRAFYPEDIYEKVKEIAHG